MVPKLWSKLSASLLLCFQLKTHLLKLALTPDISPNLYLVLLFTVVSHVLCLSTKKSATQIVLTTFYNNR